MKKIIAVLVCLALVLGTFAACGTTANTESKKLKIVATVFPQYDWTRAVLGGLAGDAELTLLLDDGVDLHSYQPTADDLIKISQCDLFIYVGGESDEWTQDALKTVGNENRLTVNLLETLGEQAKLEEEVEGMQAEEEEEEEAFDEHVWLSVRNAAVFCGAIRDALSSLDAAHASDYAANAKAYIEKLNALDAEYTAAVEAGSCRTLLFADRFPFRYLTEDYGLSYYAAFAGCSAESEASFETVAFLAGKVDELGLHTVMTIEGSNGKIADTVCSTAKAQNLKVLALDSMQSVTLQKVENGETYLGIMEENLSVLREALA